jgi:hypothetical protein
MATKKMDVPDIGNLLGEISKKRDSGELPKTERQHVQPVSQLEEVKSSSFIELKSENTKTPKQEKIKTATVDEARWSGGRPSMKREGIEYVKISPKIPKTLKKRADQARIDEIFTDEHGRPVRTLDELVAVALDRLLPPLKKS